MEENIEIIESSESNESTETVDTEQTPETINTTEESSATAEEKPEKIQTQVTVGNIYMGRVLKIKPFGAIVSLPGSAPGLVHISQIAAGYVRSVEDVLEVGDEVNVKVLSRDEASGKIALSMKDVPQMTYDNEEAYENGQYIPPPPVITAASAAAFEEKFKAWQKVSNERIAGLNKRNKRR